jgi:hypothetical protein
MKTNNNPTLPTIDTLYKWYNKFNAEYFDNKLPFVTIEYSSRHRALGDWFNRLNRIRISNQYILSEIDYKSILIHEMIHTYESRVLKVKAGHRYTFKNKMYEINYKSNNVYNIDTKYRGKLQRVNEDNTKLAEEWFVLVFDKNNVKCFVKTSDKYLDRDYMNYKSRIRDIKVYMVKGCDYLTKCTKCVARSHKYYYLSEFDYSRLIEPHIINEVEMWSVCHS